MHRYGRALRFFGSASNRGRENWDPTVSLVLEHPSLVKLEECSTRDHLKQILAQMMRTSLVGQTFPMSRLILFSAVTHPENLDVAILLFNHYTPNPNLYIYNTLISALSFSSIKSFALYNSMLKSCIYPDKHTLLFLLQASKYISEATYIHCHALVMGLFSYVYLQNSLLKMYMEMGQFGLADQVFQQMPTPDAVSFNTMIFGYAKTGRSLETFELFRKMVRMVLKPDDFTMSGLLICCGRLVDSQSGKSVHAWMERRNKTNTRNLILDNALVDMYVKCHELELAQKVFNALVEKDIVTWNTIIAGYAKSRELKLAHSFFDKMKRRDIISWNSLMAGYAQRGDYTMARKLFNDMIAENIKPDNVTMVNLVSAAAEIGALNEGRSIHGWVTRMQIEINAFLGSALIDMYSKCGSIEKSFRVFTEVIKKDVTVWTTMISGLAFHGHGNKALEMFSEMQEVVAPNQVTFVAVLTACSHSGLVDQGRRIFNNMKDYYGIEPAVEHYGCLVDLLGRSGMLIEAKKVINKMPMKPSSSIWGALLSACNAHGNLEIAEIALTELLKLEPEKEGGYVLLSNIYASCEKWSYSDKIREVMQNRGVKKIAGCSSLIVDGTLHEFVAADKRHPRWVDIQPILICLKCEMKTGADLPSDFLQSLVDSC